MAPAHRWTFRRKLRARAFGWRGSKAAIARLNQAVSEIKQANKSDPVAAGEGAVILMERLWPAFQDIDTSSGALGRAVNDALDAVIPILIDAPADRRTRAAWLERLYTAVEDDGVQYLFPVEEHWGEITVYPDLIDEFAGRLLPLVREVWAENRPGAYVVGRTICLSCLLAGGRYGELHELLSLDPVKLWSTQRFGAEALRRRGLHDAAIAYAEGIRDRKLGGYDDWSIDRFCEDTLIDAGRAEEAYDRYGLRAARGSTYLAVYREMLRRYPSKDRRRVLLDLTAARGSKGKWFAAAKDAGFLDIALDCAGCSDAEPATLIRAARDFTSTDPRFSAHVALHAIRSVLQGGGYPAAYR